MNNKGVKVNLRNATELLRNSDSDKCDCLLHDALIHEHNQLIEKKKLLIKPGGIDQLKSFNEADMPAYFKISNKAEMFQSKVKDCDSSRNRYTMHIPYIRNKEISLAVMERVTDGGREKSEKGKMIYSYNHSYKTPQFIRNRDKIKQRCNSNVLQEETMFNFTLLSNKSASPKMLMNNEAILNSMSQDTYKDNKGIRECLLRLNDDYHNVKDKDEYVNLKDKQPFYRELGKKQSESIKNFLSPLKHSPICLKNKLKTSFPLQKTNFLKMQYKDKIPLQYPLTMSHQYDNLNNGRRSRYLMLINELQRVKYVISVQKEKEREIIREFFIKNGIYNKLQIEEKHFENFSRFLEEDIPLRHFKAVSKPFKDIIIDILENNINSASGHLSESRSVGESEFQHKVKRINHLTRKQEKASMNEIYTKVPLSKQNKLIEINRSSVKEVAEDLEQELRRITKEKAEEKKRKCAKYFRSSLSTPRRKSDLHITPSLKAIDHMDEDKEEAKIGNDNEARIEDKFRFILKQPIIFKSNSSKAIQNGLMGKQYDIKTLISQKKLTELLYLNKIKQQIAINTIIQTLDINEIVD